MFENYVGAKTAKRAKWVSVLVTVSVAVHVIAVLALVVRSFWVIEKLDPPKGDLAISMAPPPPPPPPPPPAGKKKSTSTDDKPKKVKPTETVQPTKSDDPTPEVESDSDDEGEEGGVEGGVAGGVAGGVIGGSLEGVPGGVLGGPPPPPPPPQEPQIVPQVALEQQRISGEKSIIPDDDVKLQISRSGSSRVVTTVKMCLTGGGNVQSINFLKSSGYPSYDQKIRGKMREWKYRPFMVNGKPVPVCTSVTFIYNQSK